MARSGHKYIFVLGGVMSGVGKGIASSSMGLLLQQRGYKVNLVKIDPYLNVDAGTMNPTEHGEVFVLKSGLETDQDMGNYERFLNRDLGPEDYMTSGMVYQSVIERERALEYGGSTVETSRTSAMRSFAAWKRPLTRPTARSPLSKLAARWGISRTRSSSRQRA
jgi:CTP synthase (UTP-ammonia lyase)